MKLIVIIVPNWNYTDGGVNSFNFDFTKALGIACRNTIYDVVCVSIKTALAPLVDEAKENNVTVLSANCEDGYVGFEDFETIKELITAFGERDFTYYIGHDAFTGSISNLLARKHSASCSIVFHHMDYSSYHSIKGEPNPYEFDKKFQTQNIVLKNADFVVGIGPKLTKSALNKVGDPNVVFEFIPGLISDIVPNEEMHKITAISFGRYDVRTDRLKQMLLSAKAFTRYVESIESTHRNDAKMQIIGISDNKESAEFAAIAKEGATGFIGFNFMPYTTDRKGLFDYLTSSSVCLMLSVHEGFGLVGWETIASGVPLIISENTGLFEFLSIFLLGKDLRHYGIYPVSVLGSMNGNTNSSDIDAVYEAYRNVFGDFETYKRGMLILRKDLLAKHGWPSAMLSFLEILKKADTRDTDPDSSISSLLAERLQVVRKLNTTGNRQPNLYLDLNNSQSELVYRSRATPFVGRATEMDLLKQFTEQQEIFLWWTLTGRGGSGKSRVGLEHLVDLAANSGWYCGFLGVDTLVEFDWENWQPAFNTFIVIDYASRNTKALTSFLQHLSRLSSFSKIKVRVLLVERYITGSWWSSVKAKADYNKIIEPWQKDVLELQPLNTDGVLEMIGNYRYFSELNMTKLQVYNILKKNPKHNIPLYTLVLLNNLRLTSSKDDSSGNVFEIYVKREDEEIWQNIIEDLDERNKQKVLIAYITMTGEISLKSLRDLLSEQWPFFPKALNIDIISSLNLLNGEMNIISPIEPHLLGEEFVRSTFYPSSPDYSDGILSKVAKLAWTNKPDRIKNFLLRFIHDFPMIDAQEMAPEPKSTASSEYRLAWCSYQAEAIGLHIVRTGFTDGKVASVFASVEQVTEKDIALAVIRTMVLVSIIRNGAISGHHKDVSTYNDKLVVLLQDTRDEYCIMKANYLYSNLAKYFMDEFELDRSEFYINQLRRLSRIDQTIQNAELLQQRIEEQTWYVQKQADIDDARQFSFAHRIKISKSNPKKYYDEAYYLEIRSWLACRDNDIDTAIGFYNRLQEIAEGMPDQNYFELLQISAQRIISKGLQIEKLPLDFVSGYDDMVFRFPNEMANTAILYWSGNISRLLVRNYAFAAARIEVFKKVLDINGLSEQTYNNYWLFLRDKVKYHLENNDIDQALSCFADLQTMFTTYSAKQDPVSVCEAAIYLSLYFKEELLANAESKTYYLLGREYAKMGRLNFDFIYSMNNVERRL